MRVELPQVVVGIDGELGLDELPEARLKLAAVLEVKGDLEVLPPLVQLVVNEALRAHKVLARQLRNHKHNHEHERQHNRRQSHPAVHPVHLNHC